MKKLFISTLFTILSCLATFAQSGSVYVVGAGPGDPDLITLKGIKALKKADVVLYDALANPSILLNCQRNVRLVNVGKRVGVPSAPNQKEINQILINEAMGGHKVVRLKGGDPFVFGRGGEELTALRNAGIEVTIIPGVTSGIAAPAYAGIPVTHRGVAKSLTLITATAKDTQLKDAIHWKSLVDQGGTIAFYMGVRLIPQITQHLIEAGMSPEMPAAIISHGTLPEQVTLRGKLKDFTADYTDYSQLTPGILLVGEVVALIPPHDSAEKQKEIKVLSVTLNRTLSELTPRIEEEVTLAHTLSSNDPEAYSKDYLEILSKVGFTHIVFSNTKSVKAFFELCNDKGIDIIGSTNATLITLGDKITNDLNERGYKATTLGSYNEVARYLIGDKAKMMPKAVDAITGATKRSK